MSIRQTMSAILIAAIAGMPAHAGHVDMFGGGSEVVFIPPISPYLSEADNPFDLSGDMQLENFEGVLSVMTPGLFILGPGLEWLEPGPETNSVDGDDGIIDGIGDGRSMETTNGQIALLFTVDFPTQVGFAITYGLQNLTQIDIFGPTNNLVGSRLYLDPFSEPSYGTLDDVFLGFIYEEGISHIAIHQEVTEGFQIDHVTFGIPEPASLTLLLSGAAVIMRRRRLR